MDKKNKRYYIVLVVSILIIIGVVIGGSILSKKKTQEVDTKQLVDVDDADNVSVVDEKLKQGDYRVTQKYLLNYTTHKGNVWYSSKALVTKIKYNGNNAVITLVDQKNKKNKILGYITKDEVKVKKNDKVFFVGSIDLSDGNINLAKISKEEIDYLNVVEIEYNDLYDNIYYLKNTYVYVSGYMVTDGPEYKLYDSKENYKQDEEKGNFFLLSWSKDFKYTGNAQVLLRCFIGDRYKLIGCELME